MYILIPAYKPDERLITLTQELLSQTDYEILIVNDGSGPAFDHIFAALPEACTVLTHEVNCGKGRAMKTGFAYIAEHAQADALGVAIVDADGQHLLEDVQRVCDELAAHPEAVIIGARQFDGKVPLRSRFGNSLTRWVFALASGVRLSDTQTGLRAIPLRYLNEFCALRGERYEYEMNMLLSAAEKGIPMREVVIKTVYLDDNKSSHFHVIRDSLKIYAVIFKFILSSLAAFLIDFVMLYIITWLTADMPDKNLSLFISVAGARVISSLCNYFLNKKMVFKSENSLGSTIFKYYVLVAVILLANYGLMALLVNLLGMRMFWAKILTEGSLFVFSYIAQRMFVFKNRRRLKEN